MWALLTYDVCKLPTIRLAIPWPDKYFVKWLYANVGGIWVCECAPNWQRHSQWIRAHLLAIHWMQMSKSVNSQICIHCLYESCLCTAPKIWLTRSLTSLLHSEVWNIYKRIMHGMWSEVRWGDVWRMHCEAASCKIIIKCINPSTANPSTTSNENEACCHFNCHLIHTKRSWIHERHLPFHHLGHHLHSLHWHLLAALFQRRQSTLRGSQSKRDSISTFSLGVSSRMG